MVLESTPCGICTLHHDAEAVRRWELGRHPLWVLRHHPAPAPLPGWLLLDARRHLGGPVDFSPEEALAWGDAVARSSALVQVLSGCERVYAIAFGEGARHLHLHLIPRHGDEPHTEAWKIADWYRSVATGERPPVDGRQVDAVVQQGRQQIANWGGSWWST